MVSNNDLLDVALDEVKKRTSTRKRVAKNLQKNNDVKDEFNDADDATIETKHNSEDTVHEITSGEDDVAKEEKVEKKTGSFMLGIQNLNLSALNSDSLNVNSANAYERNVNQDNSNILGDEVLSNSQNKTRDNGFDQSNPDAIGGNGFQRRNRYQQERQQQE